MDDDQSNWPDSRVAIALTRIAADCRSADAANALGEMVAAFLAERAQHAAAVTAAREDMREKAAIEVDEWFRTRGMASSTKAAQIV